MWDFFLNVPGQDNPSHIFAINNLDNSAIPDSLKILDPLKGFVLKANNNVDYSKAVLTYSYFKDDSSLKRVDTAVTYDNQPNGLETKITITKTLNSAKKIGYYNQMDKKP